MDRRLRRCGALVPEIERLVGRLSGMRDAELGELIASVRARVSTGASLGSVLPEVFAVTSEAHARVTGRHATTTQLVAAAILHGGVIANVDDGEGKHLIVLLVAVLNAMSGKGVHVVAGTDQLAARDADLARPAGRLLGLEVGLVPADQEWSGHRDAYLADVVYGTASEFAYDYLRDNLGWESDKVVQRDLDCAIVNDADSVLLDECRTPHYISAPADDRESWHRQCASLAIRLEHGRHYRFDGNSNVEMLTDAADELVAAELGAASIDDPHGPALLSLRAALWAKDMFQRGREYDVVDGRLIVLGEYTGTEIAGRKFDGHMHRALQAKEGLPIDEPNQVMARIRTRGYFRLYPKLAGMSGSATRASEGFGTLYDLDTVPIPPSTPRTRKDHDDRLFPTDTAKYDAVVAAVRERHETGQPVIVGVTTARGADQVVRRLTEADLPVRVARDQDENVLAKAGLAGAVTVVTSSACRGFDAVLPRLTVLGVGRHRSRRHDDVLRGLAGRAGTQGECTFFLSGDDVANLSPDTRIKPGDSRLTPRIERLQSDYEVRTVHWRRLHADYDDVWDSQGRDFYSDRRRIRDGGADIDAEFRDLVDNDSDYSRRCQHLARASGLGMEMIPVLLTRILLRCHDKHWPRHLEAMRALEDDIRALPLPHRKRIAEFRREATDLFQSMRHAIERDAVDFFFNIKLN